MPEPLEPVYRVSEAGFSALVDELCARLGGMFSDPDLVRLRANPAHPAVQRYDALQQLKRESGTYLAAHVEVGLDALRTWLDTITWAPSGVSSAFWHFLRDVDTRDRVTSTLADESRFDDTLAELFFWGWLRGRGFEADRIEEEGMSDIAIARGRESETRAEVKRIHRGTAPRRVADVINKANSQIKKSEPPGGGVVFISLDLPLDPAPADDEVPSVAQLYVDEAIRATRSQNSSVGRVVLTWEDFITRGDWPEPIEIYVRRRSKVIEHAAPLVPPTVAADECNVQMTAAMRLSFPKNQNINQTPERLLNDLRSVTVDGSQLESVKLELGDELKRQNSGSLAVS